MRLENLRVGKSIDIFVEREGYRYRLGSKIEGCDSGKIYISLITSGNRIFQFMDSDNIQIIYRDGGRMWQWDKVKGMVALYDKTKVHCLTSGENATSFNRRGAYRVDMAEEIIIYRFQESGQEAAKDENGQTEIDEYGNEKGSVTVEEMEGCLKDLSESGAGFYTNGLLKEGDTVGFPLYTDFGIMYFKGTIVRHTENRTGKYMEFYGCCFERSHHNLARYLFSIQRERLRRQRQGE